MGGRCGELAKAVHNFLSAGVPCSGLGAPLPFSRVTSPGEPCLEQPMPGSSLEATESLAISSLLRWGSGPAALRATMPGALSSFPPLLHGSASPSAPFSLPPPHSPPPLCFYLQASQPQKPQARGIPRGCWVNLSASGSLSVKSKRKGGLFRIPVLWR